MGMRVGEEGGGWWSVLIHAQIDWEAGCIITYIKSTHNGYAYTRINIYYIEKRERNAPVVEPVEELEEALRGQVLLFEGCVCVCVVDDDW